jgi:choline dehydrogenase-like flavoprotein
MIRDLDAHGDAELSGYDLCIVGSGPAGTTLANELCDSGLRICVLESGMERPTPRGDRLRDVRSEGIRIKDYSRERVLGGASTTWAGLSSPLDPIDFEARPGLAHARWPIAREELLAYYAQAAERSAANGVRRTPARASISGSMRRSFGSRKGRKGKEHASRACGRARGARCS